MKLKIETVEMVAGHTIRAGWKAPMFRVNGNYIASSIDPHNIQGKPFDLKEGETVEVLTDPDRKESNLTWIARKV